MDNTVNDIDATINDKIVFDNKSRKYGFLNNFYISDLVIDGKTYYHVEGYFQSKKFEGEDDKLAERIRLARIPHHAKALGEQNSISSERKIKWNKRTKIEVMKRGIFTKFTTNIELLKALIKTDDNELIFNDSGDNYWGIGKDGKGNNGLGKILTGVRVVVSSMYSEEED